MNLSKIINALSLVAVLGASTATVAEALNPKAGAVVLGIAGVAAALTKTAVAFQKPEEQK